MIVQKKLEEEFVCPFCWNSGAGRIAFSNEEELFKHFHEKHMQRLIKMPTPIRFRRLSSLGGGLLSGFIFGVLFAILAIIYGYPSLAVPFSIIIALVILTMFAVAVLGAEIHSALVDR